MDTATLHVDSQVLRAGLGRHVEEQAVGVEGAEGDGHAEVTAR